MKYNIIGSEAQVAATEFGSNLNAARRFHKAARFTNGKPALVVATVNGKSEANHWLQRSNEMLAVVSGRLGRWITPTFVIVKA